VKYDYGYLSVLTNGNMTILGGLGNVVLSLLPAALSNVYLGGQSVKLWNWIY
jgi:hypothetical protein